MMSSLRAAYRGRSLKQRSNQFRLIVYGKNRLFIERIWSSANNIRSGLTRNLRDAPLILERVWFYDTSIGVHFPERLAVDCYDY